MCINYLNQFPIENLSLNVKSIQLTVLILGLVKLLRMFLSKKGNSSFFFGFFRSLIQSHVFISSDDSRYEGEMKNRDFKPSIKQEKWVDQSFCNGDAKIVLEKLGMLYNHEETSFNANEIFGLFEEKNPSLDEVKEAFDVFDNNRDGFIDAKELQKVLSSLGLKEGLEIDNCRKMIGVFDENGDGRLDLEEFVKFLEASLC